MTNEALKAMDRIFNYCEEIDNHIPEEQKTGYRMLPDVQLVINELDRLQDENTKLKEMCSKSSYKDSWKNKFFKAQEEIEYLKQHADQFLADYQKAQKQVDELKEQRDLYKQQVDIAQESHFITYETAKRNTAKEILQDLFYFIDGNNFWLEETGNQVYLIKEKDALNFMRKKASEYEVEVEE